MQIFMFFDHFCRYLFLTLLYPLRYLINYIIL